MNLICFLYEINTSKKTHFNYVFKSVFCISQGHLIESVGWNLQNANDNTTNAILLGTSKG